MSDENDAVKASNAAGEALKASNEALTRMGTVTTKAEFDTEFLAFNTQLQVVFTKAGEASFAALKANTAKADDAMAASNDYVNSAQKAAVGAAVLRDERRPTLG